MADTSTCGESRRDRSMSLRSAIVAGWEEKGYSSSGLVSCAVEYGGDSSCTSLSSSPCLDFFTLSGPHVSQEGRTHHLSGLCWAHLCLTRTLVYVSRLQMHETCVSLVEWGAAATILLKLAPGWWVEIGLFLRPGAGVPSFRHGGERVRQVRMVIEGKKGHSSHCDQSLGEHRHLSSHAAAIRPTMPP